MKIFLRVVITFVLSICFLIGLLFSFTNTDNAAELEQNSVGLDLLSSLANMTGQGSTIGDLPTAADYRRAVYFDIFFLLASVAGIVFAYVKNKNVGLIVAGVVGVGALLFYVMQPSLNGSAFAGDNDDKTFKLVTAFFALVAAGLLALLKLKFSDPAPTETSQSA